MLLLPLASHAMAERPLPVGVGGEGEGVIVTQTRINTTTPGGGPNSIAADAMGQPADCGGPALGITVSSVQSDQRTLYDVNGEPCNEATTMFDGTTPLGGRPADPAVQIGFVDAVGGVPHAPNLPPVPRVTVNSDVLAETETKTLEAPVSDPLTQTIQQWQGKTDRLAVEHAEALNRADTEATLAAVRNLDRQTTETAASQQQVTMLMAQLREKERELDAAKRRASESRNYSLQQQTLTQATLTSAQQAEQQMRAELQAAKERLAASQSQAQHLTVSKAKQDKLYQQQIATLGDDLKAAEKQAAANRNELVMQAAAKIAEAEKLAEAARLAEADAKAREAARLKQEAEIMLEKAVDLQNSKAVAAAKLGEVTKAAPMPLMSVPVIVRANNQTLPDLVESILAQTKPQAGEWHAEFQLTTQNSYILSEKWSLTAETPLEKVLESLTSQIKAAHGVTLTFTQFPQSRLVIVTDN